MKRIKVQMKQSEKSDSLKVWLDYFILAQLIKQLDISSNTKKLVLYKSLQMKKGLNTYDSQSK
ncbi:MULTISPECIES: hypothetical protein [Bacillus]|uniref:hypothetical protein n=1 Tax=Bacillus TaxID=1386 RepID=UPI0002DE10EF|nr:MULTISPECIES: hypothetical protein [Bacillus]